MAWAHRSEQMDGRWTKRFATETAALKSMVKFLGWDKDDQDRPLRANRAYYDDFGGRHVVEEISSTIRSARTDEALGRAFDARECGVATARQLALLARHFM